MLTENTKKTPHPAFLKAETSLLKRTSSNSVPAPQIISDTTRIQQALEEKTNFTDLPDDSIGCIGRFLSPVALFRLRATSREMKSIVENNVYINFKYYRLLKEKLLKIGLKEEVLRGLFQRASISPGSLFGIFKILRFLEKAFKDTIDTPCEALFFAGEINLITQEEIDLVKQKHVGFIPCALSIISLTGNIKKMTLAKEKLGFNERFVTEDNVSLIHYVTLSGSAEAMEYARKVWQLEKDAITHHGTTVLHCAALSGSPEAMACAATWELDERALNNDRATILHYAARSDSIPTLEYLCKRWDWHRTHLTETDASNKTVLHYAAMAGSLSTFRWFLRHGVPITRDNNQKTPFDLTPDQTIKNKLEKIHDKFICQRYRSHSAPPKLNNHSTKQPSSIRTTW